MNDRYMLLRVIGTGSYGIVYQANDLQTKAYRVVKQLRPSKHRSKEDIELFEDEIAVLNKLHHKRMPVLYDVFSIDGNHFYVMSLIEGDNLEDLIFDRNKTFNEKESLLLLAQLLELVDDLHQHHIFHLDLRIPNIIMNEYELFLIDFGLAKWAAAERTSTASPIKEMKQQDYYDVGDILLYLLYTAYSAQIKKALPWTEELSLEKETVHLLKRLLGVNDPYTDMNDIMMDLHAALEANE